MNDKDATQYAAWRCEYCLEYKPVPQLARDCERRHLEEWGQESP